MTRLLPLFAMLVLWSPASATPEAMQALAFLEGEWDARYYQYDEAGEEVFTGENVTRFEITLDGQLIEETMTILGTGMDFPMRTFLSWDMEKSVYRMAAVDQPGGMMDLYEGRLVDGVLTMTNLEHETFYRNANGQPMAFRLTWRFPSEYPDRYELGAEISLDLGQSWRPMSRVEFSRRP